MVTIPLLLLLLQMDTIAEERDVGGGTVIKVVEPALDDAEDL